MTDGCTCAEIEGEDPECVLHGLSLAGVAAWTDDDCIIASALDPFAVRRMVRRAVSAMAPFVAALAEWGDDPATFDHGTVWEHPLGMCITVGDFRRAAMAMEARQGGDEAV